MDLSFFEDLLSDVLYGPFYALAYSVWQWCMGIATGIIGTTPEDYSRTAWTYVEDTLYPWATAIGVSLMSLFFIIGFCRAASNFKENITLELCIESMIRLVVLNILLQKGFDLISRFFSMSSALSEDLMEMQHLAFYTGDADWGAHLFWWMFGLLYFLIVVVCGVIIVLTLYGRYIKLYLLVVFFPLAIPTMAGGRGVDATAVAWTKSFLSNTFEIVVIALVMSISSMLIAGTSTPGADLVGSGTFDGFGRAFAAMLNVILMAASVKGASAFMNKSFAL